MKSCVSSKRLSRVRIYLPKRLGEFLLPRNTSCRGAEVAIRVSREEAVVLGEIGGEKGLTFLQFRGMWRASGFRIGQVKRLKSIKDRPGWE